MNLTENTMKNICLAISGGVDSTYTGSLLLSKGFNVQGVFLKLFDSSDPKDAVLACKELGIKLDILDLRNEFKIKVQDYFAKEYLSGKTPNPCIVCNKEIKFGLLLDYALKNHFDCLATGHYVKKVKMGDRFTFQKTNHRQDQSYFLSRLSQNQIKHAFFPLGDMEKSTVRQLAEENNLKEAKKKDSLEICFIEKDYQTYFKDNNIVSACGKFVDVNGKVLGEHRGIINYTVGQRKGLGISYSEPLFVGEIKPETDEIVLVTEKELYTDKLYATSINYLGLDKISDGLCCMMYNRSQSRGEKVKVALKDDIIEAEYIEKTRISSKGQIAVFCDFDGNLLFSGIII